MTSLLTLGSLSAKVFAGSRAGDPGEDKKNGQINGTVKTNDGKPAVMVSVTLKGTGKSTLTGDDGSFVINNLKPGTYQLEISLVGYENALQTVTVEEGKTAKVSISLQLSGQQLQEVIVQSGRSPYNAKQISPTLRLNEPLLEAPQNIQIITNKVLADQQIISMSDGLIRNVSGAMRLEHWADLYTNIYMRGSRVSAFRNDLYRATVDRDRCFSGFDNNCHRLKIRNKRNCNDFRAKISPGNTSSVSINS